MEENVYSPLEKVAKDENKFAVIDSLLSEEAALGFEYGYAATEPNHLVIWEAQFGDFANGAQVVIDQFISSAEAKWGRLSGLVMLLPHGYEGQGAEHSSARLERYLQLCAQENIQVCVPSTPAQMFHLLRRQMLRKFRKPLIVLTPKSLLRHKAAVSSLAEFASGCFQPVLGDNSCCPEKVSRVIFASGKVYYDLAQAREEAGFSHIAIIRLEQLYPFPEEQLITELARYKNAKDFVLAQEEPENQGSYFYVERQLRRLLPGKGLIYAGREASAAPACGHMPEHVREQKSLVNKALS
jgi:2-oxoglutarate dehydrogenase E1 component